MPQHTKPRGTGRCIEATGEPSAAELDTGNSVGLLLELEIAKMKSSSGGSMPAHHKLRARARARLREIKRDEFRKTERLQLAQALALSL